MSRTYRKTHDDQEFRKWVRRMEVRRSARQFLELLAR